MENAVTPEPASSTTLNLDWNDGNTGWTKGLGCTTNGTIIACTYGNGQVKSNPTTYLCTSHEPIDQLVIYDNAGNKLYNSYCLFDSLAQGSVPIISTNGDVFMSDDKYVARISKDSSGHWPTQGNATWCKDFSWNSPVDCGTSGTGTNMHLMEPPGASISPILVTNGGYSGSIIAFATHAPGYVFAFYADNGTFIDRKQVLGSCSSTCPFETKNTPASSYSGTNRFYVSMNAYDDVSGYPEEDYGLLVAFEITSAPALNQVWAYAFNGPSGVSPAVIPGSPSTYSQIIFDGYGNNDPVLYKITDNGGTSPPSAPDWQTATGVFPVQIPASVTIDQSTRNCAWAYSFGRALVQCIDLTYGTPTSAYQIQTTQFISGGVPSSAITMTHTSGGDAILTMGIQKVGTSPGHILALKLAQDPTLVGTTYGEVLYDTPLFSASEYPLTQFPVLADSSGNQIVVTPTKTNRVYAFRQ